jgi:NAD(P)-dependent dehydrogenase (short-subunit alcohol dehydrogenase family)
MTDSVALITGGTGGLGKAVTRAFLARGDHAVVTFIVPAEADEMERTVQGSPEGERLTLVRADVTEQAGIDAAVSRALEVSGRIDSFVGLVGGWTVGQNVWESDGLRWERMMELNLTSAWHAVRTVTPHMVDARYGRIVLVSSRAARSFPAGQVPYAVAKAGVITLVEAAAGELRQHGVTINCVLPSIVDTSANRQARPSEDPAHWVKPEELAHVIAFLTSPEASAVSGAAIPVYGMA